LSEKVGESAKLSSNCQSKSCYSQSFYMWWSSSKMRKHWN